MKRKHFRTIWHPIFYTVIKKTRPRGYEVQYEVPLGTLPPRADLLMLRKVGVKQGKVRELPSLFNRLGEHTILEYKGATATCEARDIDVLLGYGSLYGARRGLGVERVVLMLLSGRLEERVREGLERRGVVLEEVESGVWEGYLAGHKFVYFELEKVWRSDEANEVLGLATKALLEEGFTLKRLTKRTAELYYEVGHALKGPVHYMEEDMEGENAVKKGYRRGLEKVLSKLGVDERLLGLAPQEVLSRYPTSERLAGLAPQERLAGLAPQERLAGLAPQEVLSRYPTSERLAGLAPQERLAGLAVEDKRELLLKLKEELEQGLLRLHDKPQES